MGKYVLDFSVLFLKIASQHFAIEGGFKIVKGPKKCRNLCCYGKILLSLSKNTCWHPFTSLMREFSLMRVSLMRKFTVVNINQVFCPYRWVFYDVGVLDKF